MRMKDYSKESLMTDLKLSRKVCLLKGMKYLDMFLS